MDLEKTNSLFNSELQQQIDGTLPKGHIYKLGNPEQILKDAGVPDLPIELNAERLARKASENYRSIHPFDLSDVKNLPNEINNPIAIFNSTKPNDNSKMILTKLQHNSNNFIVVIKTYLKSPGRNIETRVNTISSLYPKDKVKELLNWLKSDKLTAWKNEEKALRFVQVQSTNLIADGSKTQSLYQ
ncbi:MAG: hypothetical protein LBU89_10970 [Fibromonadaceae bacterium]|jgi:hypothetical protein|nr:hypothetical protein [Fibromonadaceae bacterium]